MDAIISSCIGGAGFGVAVVTYLYMLGLQRRVLSLEYSLKFLLVVPNREGKR